MSLLPPNRTGAEAALEAGIRAGTPDLSAIAQLMDPERCPPDLLMWLAWGFSVDVWDEGWSEETRRAVASGSVDVHRRKGTVAAVRDVIRSAGFNDIEINERFGWEVADGTHLADGSVTGAPPDHWTEYRVTVRRLISIEQAAQIRALLEATAPARSTLKAIEFQEAAGLADGALIADGTYTAGSA